MCRESIIYKEDHADYLKEKNIETYYSDISILRRERVHSIVKAIKEFNPEVIFTTSEISLARQILTPYYPIVYLSQGISYFSSFADVYLFRDQDGVKKENEKYNLLNIDHVHNFEPGFNPPKPYKNVSREDLNLTEEDFVLITVGNRLDNDMDEKYMDLIYSFLLKKSNVKWLIVGSAKLSYLEKNYQNLLNDKIIRIQYEDDLAALYRICDVFINPDRIGGGFSIAIAMSQSLPVVTMRKSSAGLTFVGDDSCVEPNFQAYVKV